MNKLKVYYWVATGLFAAFMAFTAIPDILMVPDAMDFMTNKLHYPAYFVPFIGVAKLLGAVAILIPGFRRIKEWAYAGLFFDLAGAAYSIAATGGHVAEWGFMILPVAVLFTSYFLNHKLITPLNQNV